MTMVTVVSYMCCIIPVKKTMPLALGIREFGVGHLFVGLNNATMVNSSLTETPSIHWKVTILNESSTLSTLSYSILPRAGALKNDGFWQL
jgi:hypothetical protein